MGVSRKLLSCKPADLTPHTKNARFHSASQIKELQKSLREFGFVRPIVVNAEKTILAGHGVREAAIAEGLDRVPVLQVTGLSEEQERAYLLVDNRMGELSRWDQDMVSSELIALDGIIDLADLGFQAWKIPKPKSGGGEIDPESFDGSHTCPRCGFEWDD